MKKINMQYPFGNTSENQLLDGAVHQITPQFLYPLQRGERTFYIMEYFDHSCDCQAFTIITNIDGIYTKIPLDDYNCLFDFLRNNPLPRLTPEALSLPQTIILGQTLQAQALLYEPEKNNTSKKIPSLDFELYVPINVNGNTNVQNTIYHSSHIVASHNQTYHFRKGSNFFLQDRGVERGLHNYYVDENGLKKYDFEIVVPEGTLAKAIHYDANGRAVEQHFLIIPGLHRYHVTYADFVVKEDYINAIRTNKIEINDVPWPKYQDLHDTDKAFTDGGNKMLGMTFVDYMGRSISSNNMPKGRK